MTCQDITTQQELDQALTDNAVTCVHIKSERGVWLRLTENGNATVRADGNATVEAYGNATVQADGNATVQAYGNATVRAYGNATVEAYGNATVEAYGNATVRAYGNATVQAYGNATVRAYGNATVRAYGNATVEAYGNATVQADGNATVQAYGNATVRAAATSGVHAYGRSTVTAGAHVAVHLHSAQARVSGGVLIDVTNLNLDDAATWLGHHGVEVTDGVAALYKAVGDDYAAGEDWNRTVYTVGADLVCEDWREDNECGGGLHLSPTPWMATTYRPSAKRWLRCTVAVEDMRPINDGTPKCKVRALRVEAEVDRAGRELAATKS